MEETIFDQLFSEIIISLVIGFIIGFSAWLRNIKNTQNESCKRLWRLEKAFVLFVKMELDQTLKDHPDTNVKSIQNIIDEILKDELKQE